MEIVDAAVYQASCLRPHFFLDRHDRIARQCILQYPPMFEMFSLQATEMVVSHEVTSILIRTSGIEVHGYHEMGRKTFF